MQNPILGAGPLAGLPHIDVLAPRDPADEACLAEIREVLFKHGKATRFGVALLHHHFAVAPDEVLVEECDPVTRVLTTRPVPLAQLGATRSIQTNWRMDIDGVTAECTQCCSYDDDNRHTGSSHL